MRYENRHTYFRGSLSVGLKQLIDEHNVLLHGTTIEIPRGSKLQLNGQFQGFATDVPRIAIMKALYRNTHGKLVYPWMLPYQSLPLTIENAREGVEADKGYIHIIADAYHFNKDTFSNWQYSTNSPEVRLLGRLEVRKDDYVYGDEVKYV